MKLRKVINIGLVLLSMLSIYLFSSENAPASTSTSKKVVKEVVSIVVKDEKKVDKIVDKDIKYFRKLAHLIEYFILGLLLINVWADGKSDINYKYIILAVLIAFIYAASDEYHQTKILGRSGQFTDCLIDTFGSFLGALFYYIIFKVFRKKV